MIYVVHLNVCYKPTTHRYKCHLCPSVWIKLKLASCEYQSLSVNARDRKNSANISWYYFFLVLLLSSLHKVLTCASVNTSMNLWFGTTTSLQSLFFQRILGCAHAQNSACLWTSFENLGKRLHLLLNFKIIIWKWVADSMKGSDIVLEAILEAEVAHSAKDFFSQPQNQILVNKEVTYLSHRIIQLSAFLVNRILFWDHWFNSWYPRRKMKSWWCLKLSDLLLGINTIGNLVG